MSDDQNPVQTDTTPVRPELVEGLTNTGAGASTGSARTDGDSSRTNAVLSAQGLTKRFHEGRLDVTVLKGVNLAVRAGETVAIVGASGSGKSTLLHLLGGLDAPTSGSVQLMGQGLSGLNAAQQGELRTTHLGFVYPFHQLVADGRARALSGSACPTPGSGT